MHAAIRLLVLDEIASFARSTSSNIEQHRSVAPTPRTANNTLPSIVLTLKLSLITVAIILIINILTTDI